MRVFFGIEVPAALGRRLERVQSLLRRSAADVRWAKPAGLHFTLAFVGEIGIGQVLRLDELASHCATASDAFETRFAGIGTFPPKGRPRVVWAGVHPVQGDLASLRHTLTSGLAALGLETDARPYRPHVTLGRIRTSRGSERLGELVAKHADDDFGKVRISRFVLFESRRGRGGVHYERAATYALGDSD